MRPACTTQVSDVVARASLAPTNWLNLTYRTRLDHKTFATRMADALATVGVPKFAVSAGYIYSTFNPYTLFDQPPPPPAGSAFFTPRNEITVGASSNWGKYRFSGWARRNLQPKPDGRRRRRCSLRRRVLHLGFPVLPSLYLVTMAITARRLLLLQMTFKTVGQFGFKAL